MNTEQRLTAIEKRLTVIEKSIDSANLPQESPNASNSDMAMSAMPLTTQNPLGTTPISTIKLENWLGIFAIICFVIAGGFIIKLSIDLGWMTPPVRIASSIILGIALIAAGFALKSKDQQYASLLPAAGIIILYLANCAAHSYYQLVDFEVAIMAIIATSLLCLWMYTKMRYDIYIIITAIGSYVTPYTLIMISAATPSLHLLLYYYLVCSLTFAILSVYVQSPTLNPFVTTIAILMTSMLSRDYRLYQDIVVPIILALQFMAFVSGAYLYAKRHNTQLGEAVANSLMPALMLFYCMEYILIDAIKPGLAPWMLIGLAGLIIILYRLAQYRVSVGTGATTLVFAFATLVCFHSVYMKLLTDTMQHWSFVLIILAAAFISGRFGRKQMDNLLIIPCIGVIGILFLEYAKMIEALAFASTPNILVSLASLASMWVFIAMSMQKESTKSYVDAALLFSHFLAILALYRLADPYGSLAVSSIWLLYAILVMAAGFYWKDQVMVRSALFVLVTAASKALLYDAWHTPTIVRIICLLMTGAVLYSSGLILHITDTWQEGASNKK